MSSLSKAVSGEFIKMPAKPEVKAVIIFYCSNECLCQFSHIVANIGGGSPSYSLIGTDIR